MPPSTAPQPPAGRPRTGPGAPNPARFSPDPAVFLRRLTRPARLHADLLATLAHAPSPRPGAGPR